MSRFSCSVCAVVSLSLVLIAPSTGATGKPHSGSQDTRPAVSNRGGGTKTPARRQASRTDAELAAHAARLHREAIVIDTHNDITSPMVDEGFDLGSRGDDPNAKTKTHTDLRRMKAGGLDAEFFAVYVGREFIEKKHSDGGGAARRALDIIDEVYKQVQRHPDTLEMAYTSSDIRRIARKGKIAALMGIEGGHAIEDSLRTLRMFYKLGIRYMTLTHSNTNDWADSSGDINDAAVNHHNGLTEFGREVVREMNRIGMMVDISHVADKTFYDVIEVTRAPVIASHSSARALADHPRNMTDDMLKAVARNGGVVMVNFYDGFLDQRKAGLAIQARAIGEEANKRYPNDPQRARDEVNKWVAANDPGRTPLATLINHIDHIAKVAGIDHVGIGSDFDGVPFTGLPAGMEDISKLPAITVELLKRGYSDADIKKVLGNNLLRVMSEVERVSNSAAAAGGR